MAGQPKTASSPRRAAARTVRTHRMRVSLPGNVVLTLPAPEQLAFYGGIGVLAVLEIVEWPVAALLIVGHVFAESRHSRMIQEFGKALEQA
jgi:hypothetical protein